MVNPKYIIPDWNDLVDECDTLDLSPSEKEKSEAAFRRLKEQLGKDFLQRAFEIGHPVVPLFLNRAPWTRRWFTWLSEALERLAGVEGFPQLIGKIQSKDSFSEGVSITDFADCFASAGLKVAIEPVVPGTKKVPDLGLADEHSGDQLLVEISALDESDEQRRADFAFDAIRNLLWGCFPNCSFRLISIFGGEELNEVVDAVRALVESSRKSKALATLAIDGKIELAVALEHDLESLRAWAQERNLRVGDAQGADLAEHISRLTLSKIKKKQKQLPNDIPGIIIITTDRSLLTFLHNPIQIISEVQSVLADYPQVLATVIRHQISGLVEDAQIDLGGSLYIQRMRHGAIREQRMVVFSNNCQVLPSPSTMNRLRKALGDLPD